MLINWWIYFNFQIIVRRFFSRREIIERLQANLSVPKDRKSRNVKQQCGYSEDSDTEDITSSDDDDDDDDREKLYTKWEQNRIPFCDEYVFPCDRWLADNDDDGQIARELKPTSVTTFYRIKQH